MEVFLFLNLLSTQLQKADGPVDESGGSGGSVARAAPRHADAALF